MTGGGPGSCRLRRWGQRVASRAVPVSSPAQGTPGLPHKRRWRYTRWGSIFLAVDFCLAFPIGIALGALPAFSVAVRKLQQCNHPTIDHPGTRL